MNHVTRTLSLGLMLTSAAFAAPLAPAGPAPTTYMGGNITREYRASDLKTSYGILDVGMGEIWVLNLPDTVVDVITSKDGVLQFKQTGSRVIVGALASSGSYPILIMTQDSVYFFQARLNPSRGGGVRNIVVRADQAPDDEQQFAGFPTAPAAPVSPVTPRTSTPTGGSRVLNTATPPAVTVPTPVLAPRPAPVAPPAASSAPAGLTPPAPAAVPPAPVVSQPPAPAADPAATSSLNQVQARFTAEVDGTDTVLSWRIRNETEGDLIVNERAFRITSSAGPAIYQATRASVRVAPGKTEYGTVVVKGVLDPVLTVQWAATRFGTGQSVSLTQRVAVTGTGAWLAPR